MVAPFIGGSAAAAKVQIYLHTYIHTNILTYNYSRDILIC